MDKQREAGTRLEAFIRGLKRDPQLDGLLRERGREAKEVLLQRDSSQTWDKMVRFYKACGDQVVEACEAAMVVRGMLPGPAQEETKVLPAVSPSRPLPRSRIGQLASAVAAFRASFRDDAMNKMLKNIHNLFKFKEGPELLPIKARLWILSFSLAMGLSIYLFKNGTYFQTTAFGVLLSVFGAGVLYWETVISDEEANGVYHEITREGSSRNLSESEQNLVLWFFQAGSFELILLAVIFVYEIRHGKNFTSIKIILLPISLLVVSFGPMTAVYATLKFMKSSNNKNLTLMKNKTKEERVVLIRTYLRRFGFKTLFAAGMLQYVGIAFDYYK